jgi:hypothetical protein
MLAGRLGTDMRNSQLRTVTFSIKYEINSSVKREGRRMGESYMQQVEKREGVT